MKLTETPAPIGDLNWDDINDYTHNHQLFMVFNASRYKKLIESLTDYAKVYQLSSQFFCLDIKAKQVTYYMRYQVGNNGKLGSYVWQSFVWSDGAYPYIHRYPQKIFFKYLLPKFGTIITDSEQTWNGKRFWQYRIQEAFNMKLNVYYYDFSTHNIIKMHHYDDFIDAQNQYDIWGNTPKHLMKRMVISNKELPLTK